MKNKVGFTPNGDGVLLDWKAVDEEKVESGIIVPDAYRAQHKAEQEMLENGITTVAAVGPKCTLVKPGDWILLNAPGRLINVEGCLYGLVKEYQIDGVFAKEPIGTPVDIEKLKENSLSDGPGGLKLDKHIKSAKKLDSLNGDNLSKLN